MVCFCWGDRPIAQPFRELTRRDVVGSGSGGAAGITKGSVGF